MNRCLRAASFAALLALSQTAFAQNAQITGTAKDETGGILPGVTVTAKNQESGLVRSAVSDGSGNYRLAALPPGPYAVSAQLAGFRGEDRQVLLVIDQTATIAFTLHPASMTESLEVVAEAPLVDTTISTVSTSVSNEQIQNLPVASGRLWNQLRR